MTLLCSSCSWFTFAVAPSVRDWRSITESAIVSPRGFNIFSSLGLLVAAPAQSCLHPGEQGCRHELAEGLRRRAPLQPLNPAPSKNPPAPARSPPDPAPQVRGGPGSADSRECRKQSTRKRPSISTRSGFTEPCCQGKCTSSRNRWRWR